MVRVTPAGSTTTGTLTREYPSGTSVQLDAFDTAGYTFREWQGDLDSASRSSRVPVSTRTVTMDRDRTVTAVFSTTQKYTLTVIRSGSGSVAESPAPTNGTYDEGTEVELTATPAWNHYVQWGGDGSGCSGTTRLVTMDADKTVTATFIYAPPPPVTYYTLTTGVSPSGAGVISSGGVYVAGTQVTVHT